MDAEAAARLLVDEYSRMAEAYDRDYAPYHASMERVVLRLADLKPGEQVLDLGCGPGNLAFRAARCVGKLGLALGIDLAPGMVRVASARAARDGVANVRFGVMDARALALPDASFDAAISCLGVPSLGHERCFAEVYRVLRARGRFVFCEGMGKGSGVGRAFRDLLDEYQPREPPPEVARLLGARRCLMETGQPSEARDPVTLRTKLQRLGFHEVRVTTKVHRLVYPTADAYLARVAAMGDNERELRAMGAGRRRRFREDLVKRLAPFRTANGFPAPQENLYVWARV